MTPRNVSAPACAQTTRRPVGSGSSAASNASSRSSAANVPRPPSSSDGTACRTTSGASAPERRIAASACSAATTAPFMSTEPRPNRWPSATAPENGSRAHGSLPGPTTSMWPLSAMRPGALPGSVAVAPHSSVRAASSPGWSGWARSAARSCACSAAVRPARVGAGGDELRRGALVARHARDADQVGGVARERVEIECGEGGLLHPSDPSRAWTFVQRDDPRLRQMIRECSPASRSARSRVPRHADDA